MIIPYYAKQEAENEKPEEASGESSEGRLAMESETQTEEERERGREAEESRICI